MTGANWSSAFFLRRLRMYSFVWAWADSYVRCRQEKGELTRWQTKNEFQVKDLYDMDAFVEDVFSPPACRVLDRPPSSWHKSTHLLYSSLRFRAAGRWSVWFRLEILTSAAGSSVLFPGMSRFCLAPRRTSCI